MSFKLIVFACFLAVSHSRHRGASDVPYGTGILFDHDAIPGEFPHQVSLMWGYPPKVDFQHFCGGTILSEKWILSVQHCFDRLPDTYAKRTLIVKAGKHNLDLIEETEQTSIVATWIGYAGFNESAVVSPFDHVMIKLETPLRMNKWVAAIKLPPKDFYPIEGLPMVMSGWGAETFNTTYEKHPHILQKIDLLTVNRDKCNEIVKSIALEEGKIVDDLVGKANICAGPLDGGITACIGDSGSPLIWTNRNGEKQIMGLLSWTLMPCGRKGAPAVFVSVSSSIHFITNVMSEY